MRLTGEKLEQRCEVLGAHCLGGKEGVQCSWSRSHSVSLVQGVEGGTEQTGQSGRKPLPLRERVIEWIRIIEACSELGTRGDCIVTADCTGWTPPRAVLPSASIETEMHLGGVMCLDELEQRAREKAEMRGRV